jgi:hypothetical protein
MVRSFRFSPGLRMLVKAGSWMICLEIQSAQDFGLYLFGENFMAFGMHLK